jgi:hypothetical protein
MAATFTAGLGLLAWPLGFCCILFSRPEPEPTRRVLMKRIVLWTTGGVVAVVLFLNDYKPFTVPWRTGFSLVAEQPMQALQYSLVYLGSGLAGDARQAAWFGGALVGFALSAAWLSRRSLAKRTQAVPFACLTALVLMSMVLLLRGRLGLGVDQAFTASRYVTTSSLFAVGVYGVLLAAKAASRGATLTFRAFIVFLALGTWNSYSSGLTDGKRQFERFTTCSEVLRCFRLNDDQRLLCTSIDPQRLRKLAVSMEQYDLSLFRGGSQRCESR